VTTRLATATDILSLTRLVVNYLPRVRVPRHVARLVTGLVVDYFAYAEHPAASTCRAARRTARRRLLCLAWLVVDYLPRFRVPRHVARLVVAYFTYAVRPSASARRAARHEARRRLLCVSRLCLAATLALLQPRRASQLLV
jgi:hypothetical protein